MKTVISAFNFAGVLAVQLNSFFILTFDIIALILALIVIVNYFVYKHMRTRTSRIFEVLSFCVIASATLNFLLILATLLDANEALVFVLRLFEYIALTTAGVMFLIYTTSAIYENREIPKFIRAFSMGDLVFNYLFIILWAISYPISALNPDIMRYLVLSGFIISLLIALVITSINMSFFRKVQRFNILFFINFSILATVLQCFFRILQVYNFAMAVSLFLIFISLHNPEDMIDHISEAFNHRSFVIQGEAFLRTKESFKVFVMELNNFAIINSSFGADGGNKIIREIYLRLRAILPKDINIYRLSGVRFAIIFNEEAELEEFKSKYPGIFTEPIIVGESPITMSAIACVISYPEIAEKMSATVDIIKYYRTKAESADVIFEATRDAIDLTLRRDKVDYAIRRAIENNSFRMYYQPIWSVKDGQFNSCEALIRLNDPDLGFIGPDEFIPIAEQTGRIIAIGRFVVEDVCRFLTEKHPDKFGLKFIDINLSVIQCMHPEIINDIDGILKKYGVPREMVNLEVTETASAQSYALLQSRLNELHSNGFTISLDDFGTGFSSVEYLINFPFDVVKLDKSLVWAYMSTKKYEPILQHYMPMLHGLGTRIVAEGVETYAMVKALEDLGCDYLQGYYFSKPIPEDDFLVFLEKNYDVKTA